MEAAASSPSSGITDSTSNSLGRLKKLIHSAEILPTHTKPPGMTAGGAAQMGGKSHLPSSSFPFPRMQKQQSRKRSILDCCSNNPAMASCFIWGLLGLLIVILWVLHTRAPSDSFGLGSTLHGIGKSGTAADTAGTGMSRKFGAQDDLMTAMGLQNALVTAEEYVPLS